MTSLLKKWLPIFVALVVALAVLFSYLFPTPLVVSYRGGPTRLHEMLIDWAVVIAGFVFILGALNVARVHAGRVLRRKRGWPYSVVLLIALVLGFIPPMVGLLLPPLINVIPGATTQIIADVHESVDQIVFNHVIGALGASLAGLVAFTLALAAFRMLRKRRSRREIVLGWIFVAVVVLVLITGTPIAGNRFLAADVRFFIVDVVGMAGMRGLLLGVALGTIITAVRLIPGDRPQSEF